MTLLIYFLQYLTSIAIFFLVGSLILRVFKISSDNPFFEIASRVLLGLIVLTVSFAMIRTEGKTIMSFSIIPLILFLKNEQNKVTPFSPKIDYNKLGILLVFGVLIFALKKFFYMNGFIPTFNAMDYFYYGRISRSISFTGLETGIIDYIYPPTSVMPYHYSQVWINALISYFSGLNHPDTLNLSTYNIVIFITYSLIISLFYELKLKLKAYIYILAFISLMFGLFKLDFYNQLPLLKTLHVIQYNFFFNSKQVIISCLLALSANFFLKESKDKAIGALLLLPIFYTTTAPPVFSSIFLWVLFDFFREKYRVSVLLKRIAVIVSTAIGIIIFYYLYYDGSGLKPEISDLYFKTFINIIVGTFIQVGWAYLPLTILAVYNYKSILKLLKTNRLVYLPFLLFTSGLFFWGLTNFQVDSAQIFSNICITMINLFAPIILIYIITSETVSLKKYTYYCCLFIFVLLGIYINIKHLTGKASYSDPYILFIEESEIENTIGVYLKHESNYISPNNNTSVHILCEEYISRVCDSCQPVDLSIFNNLKNKEQHHKHFEHKYKINLKISTFYKFVQEQKKKNIFKSIEQSQADFIDEYNVKYGVVGKGVQPSKLITAKIKKKYTDEISGHTFILFR